MQRLNRYRVKCIVLSFLTVLLAIGLMIALIQQRNMAEENMMLKQRLTGAYNQLERVEHELEVKDCYYDELARHTVELIGIK